MAHSCVAINNTTLDMTKLMTELIRCNQKCNDQTPAITILYTRSITAQRCFNGDTKSQWTIHKFDPPTVGYSASTELNFSLQPSTQHPSRALRTFSEGLFRAGWPIYRSSFHQTFVESCAVD